MLTRLGGFGSRPRAADTEASIGLRERHITTSPLTTLSSVTMAEAGKIAKSLASMGGRQAQLKARLFALEPDIEQC
jgi:hypothetical protein